MSMRMQNTKFRVLIFLGGKVRDGNQIGLPLQLKIFLSYKICEAEG